MEVRQVNDRQIDDRERDRGIYRYTTISEQPEDSMEEYLEIDQTTYDKFSVMYEWKERQSVQNCYKNIWIPLWEKNYSILKKNKLNKTWIPSSKLTSK